MHVRMNVSDLVKLISRALRHHGASATVAVPDELHPLRASDVSVLPRLFGIGLGLLSMQMDLLDSLIVAAAKEREGENDTAAAGLSLQSGRIALSQLEQQYAQHSQQGRLQQLRRQEESFAALLVDLWGSLIAANTLTWLELSCYPTLGAQEEVAVKTDCWLYGAIVGAVGEAASGNLRGELIPTVQQQAAVVPAGKQSLLQQALSSSQVISKRLGSDGDIEDVRGGQENQRVVHIIKVCVNMALGAGSVGNMQ